MKVAIVSTSDLLAAGRWDAEFHVLSTSLRERADELREAIDTDQAMEMLGELRTSDLRCLSPLTRTKKMDRTELLAAAGEFPHLALAIVQLDMARAIPAVVHELNVQQRYLDTINDIAATLKAATGLRP